MFNLFLSEMETFFEILIFGNASWLFLLIILGLGFLISWRIRAFSLVMVVACLFLMIMYIEESNPEPTSSMMWRIVLLGVGMVIFLLRLAGVSLYED